MFALGHPEKITDFAYRAMHETVVKAKLITAAFYGKGPKYSYYNGCSTGGRQGLIEITKFPEDFDAASVGAPANPHVHLHAAGVERSLELMKNNAPLTQAKVETLHKAVMDSCDALDGVKDGIISNPEKCHYDPSALLCKAADGPTCLTAGELETVKIVFGDVKTKKGEVIWTGYPPGTELQVGSLRTVPTGPGGVWDVIRILGHQDKDYDWHNFDLDTEVAQADKAGIDVLTYDLSAFKAHGGKLLLYHGWADSSIPPGHTVLYYKEVLSEDGEEAGRLVQALHGAGHGALRRRPRSRPVQQDGRDRTLARSRPGSGVDHRVARHRQQRGYDASAVSRIRRSRCIRAPAAPTTRRVSPASCSKESCRGPAAFERVFEQLADSFARDRARIVVGILNGEIGGVIQLLAPHAQRLERDGRAQRRRQIVQALLRPNARLAREQCVPSPPEPRQRCRPPRAAAPPCAFPRAAG